MRQEKKQQGRPKIKNPKNDVIRFRITPDDKQELQQIAESKGISMSSLIVMWVKEKISEERSKPL